MTTPKVRHEEPGEPIEAAPELDASLQSMSDEEMEEDEQDLLEMEAAEERASRR